MNPDGAGAQAAGQPERMRTAAAQYGEQDERGVDLSLLPWMLQLSPKERLARMEQHARDTE